MKDTIENFITIFAYQIRCIVHYKYLCNEMSVSTLITAHRGYQAKLKNFKKTVADYCQEMGYI